MVECKPYESIHKQVWNNFVASSKTPLFFFKREFLEYHSDRFIDASFLFYKDDQLLAVFPATAHDDVIVSHGGLTYGGVILTNKARIEVVTEIFSALVTESQNRGFKKIIYKPTPYIFHNYAAQEDLYCVINNLKGHIFRRDFSSVIYLDKRIKLSKGRKWLIAKAKKENLTVVESVDWSGFYQLLSHVLAKHSASPVHSVSELEYLSSEFSKNIKLQVVMLNDDMLAAALLFKFDNVVHTQYLAVSDEGKEVGALDYLIETCIQDAKDKGFDYFSFGVSTEDQGTVLNSGLAAQKESFGGRGLTLDFYEVDIE